MVADPDIRKRCSAGFAAGLATGTGRRRSVPVDCVEPFSRTAERYRGCGRGAYGYVRSKLRRDPVHWELLRLAAEDRFGAVVDIGCGRGQLGIALLEAGLATSVIGMDCHAAHLAQAERAAAGLAFRARLLNLANGFDIQGADALLGIDVLYQLDDDAQRRLLEAVAEAAPRRIFLRLLDPGRGLRSILTVWMERLSRRISPHAGRFVNPWPIGRIAACLEAAGYDVTLTPCWRGTPFANVLLDARRRR